MTKPQDLIQPRAASYFRSSLYARWVVIAVVAATFWFLPDIQHSLVASLIVLATAYNCLLLLGAHQGWRAVTDQQVMLGIDSFLTLLLAICTTGLHSPYLLILALVIISASYWYGVWVALSIVAIQTAVMLCQQIIQHPGALFPKEFIIQMLILGTIGLYVAWLTESERSERDKLTAIGIEAEQERQQLFALINNMSDAVIVVDNDNRVAIHNQAAAVLAGIDEGMYDQPLADVIKFVDPEGKRTPLKIKGNVSEQQDRRVKAPDGSLINVSVSIAPYIVDRQNRGHVLIIHDTTQEATIDQERKEFIAVASHELRTPLTIAQGDLSLLLASKPKDPESTAMLQGALRGLQQLSHIISDLTNLSKVENQQLDVQLEPLNPITLLHEFQSDYSSQAEANNIELKIDIDPHLNAATILTSRYVVREILAIYLTNALKFTDKGSVTIGVMNPKDERTGVTFHVTDTGAGISQSDQNKLFKKFFQSEDYETRLHGGTGLGLYIAHQLAKRITAKVWFDTKLGKGSTFYLWVPPYSKHRQDNGKVAAAETKDFFSNI